LHPGTSSSDVATSKTQIARSDEAAAVASFMFFFSNLLSRLGYSFTLHTRSKNGGDAI
jgi:hypothetical protein